MNIFQTFSEARGFSPCYIVVNKLLYVIVLLKQLLTHRQLDLVQTCSAEKLPVGGLKVGGAETDTRVSSKHSVVQT